MKLENEFVVPVPRDEAWDVLMDVERIAPCMPGATFDGYEGDSFMGRVKVKLGPGWGHHYEKFHRTAQAWALVGVAALVHRSNGSISEARVGLTNMGSTPLRATATESALAGVDASAAAVAGAAAHAADGTSPSADLHAGADYREHLARVLTRRAVSAAAGV